MTDKTIVITRPKGDEEHLRDELVQLGCRVIHEPLTEIFLNHTARSAIENALMDDPDAVIVTSRHGVHALALLSELRDVFVLCVGEATVEAAESLGFTRVSFAGATVDRMIDYVMDGYDDDARFLYISGEHVSADIGEILGVRGMQVEHIAAYDAQAASALSDTLVEQLRRKQIHAVTFLSARAAEIFVSLSQKASLAGALAHVDAFCISRNVADTARSGGFANIFTADEPALASLVTCVDNTYGNNENVYG